MAILLRRGFIPDVSAFDPATTAWVNAVFAVDTTVVSNTEKTLVDTVIKALRNSANGDIFSTWDDIWLMANADISLTEATVGIVNNKILSKLGAGTPTISSKGVTVAGANAAYDSTVNLSTAAHYSTGSAALAIYVTQADTTAGNIRYIGAETGTVGGFLGMTSGPNRSGSCMNDTPGDVWVINPSQDGLMLGSRINSGTSGEIFYLWNAANPTGTNTASSDPALTPPNLNAYILADNNNGSVSANTNAIFSMAAIGSGLTSGQAANFNSAINAYMTSLGIAIY